jgi:ankyrin repeat protein
MEVVMSESPSPRALPDQPSLEQLRKQAKDLRAAGPHASLSAAQLALAREYGFPSWARLKRAVELRTLRRLIEDGDPGPVARLLEGSLALARARFEDGSTPLHVAAGEDRADVVEVLVRFGAPVQSRYAGSGHSPLSWAVTCWSFRAARRLVALGEEPDLFCAAGLGLLDVVQAFWDDGRLRPGPSRTGSTRFTASGERLPCPPERDVDHVSDALYIACRCDQLAVARWLLEHGADPNWRGYIGGTCLAWAEFSGNAELGALLRAAGGSDALHDFEFDAPPRAFAIMVLAGWGFPGLLRERLTADPSLVSLTGGRGTPLHAAAAAGHAEIVRILLGFGADRSTRDPAGRTAAEVAAAQGHAEVAALLA